MPKEQSPGKPTTRTYRPEAKAAAVRIVRALRTELDTEHRTVQRVAQQLGYEIFCSWPAFCMLAGRGDWHPAWRTWRRMPPPRSR
jgi:transposase